MDLPGARGPISEAVVGALRRLPEARDVADISQYRSVTPLHSDPLLDEDLQITLWICYERRGSPTCSRARCTRPGRCSWPCRAPDDLSHDHRAWRLAPGCVDGPSGG